MSTYVLISNFDNQQGEKYVEIREKTYILQGPAFATFILFLTGGRSRPTPVRVAIKSDHDILPLSLIHI